MYAGYLGFVALFAAFVSNTQADPIPADTTELPECPVDAVLQGQECVDAYNAADMTNGVVTDTDCKCPDGLVCSVSELEAGGAYEFQCIVEPTPEPQWSQLMFLGEETDIEQAVNDVVVENSDK